MKVLLTAVNAKYIHSNPAVYSLKAFAGEYGEQVEIGEFTINHYPDEILQEIYRKRPDVVAFSCYIWNLPMVERLMEDLPRVLPFADIWVGGPEVSFDAEEFLTKHPTVTGVMVGEGEETFEELTGYYVKEGRTEREKGAAQMQTGGGEPQGLQQIRGLVYRDGEGKIRRNPPRPLLDLDKIPFIYENLNKFENRIIYYESSRGCPFSCSYCLSSIDKSVRFRSLELVKKELQYFLDRKVPQVKFVDRTFNCRHSHALAIWSYLKEHDNGITNFHFEIAADLLNQEELELLNSMRPGLVQLEIGVQSTNLRTIGEIDRVMDFDRLGKIVKRIQAGRNIHQHLDLIAGLPYEGYESFQKSFNDVYGLHPDQLQLGFLKVLKGSKMHRNGKKYGLVYHGEPMYEVFHTDWISYDEILKLKAVEEMVEVYYNSGQFARTIRRLEGEFSSPFELYQSLDAYYERENLNGQNHSRMNRFVILRNFIRTVSSSGIYDELLTLDIYLRENSKSRPAWAEEQVKEKAAILEFYRQEEEMRAYLEEYQPYTARQMMHMTHLERFHWNVWGNGEQKECWLLFDYKKRDPLTHNAKVLDVTENMQRIRSGREKEK